uniref:Thyroglobulin type-1 domain-containing protein n=1 Tax=Sphaeramia orbicularis TaxID=375764 RepID=A0A672YL16_9TELE
FTPIIYIDQANHDIGEFIPKCDIYGNFQPQQCWAATGSCWCVNILTGQEVPHTRTPPGTTPVNCGE